MPKEQRKHKPRGLSEREKVVWKINECIDKIKSLAKEIASKKDISIVTLPTKDEGLASSHDELKNKLEVLRSEIRRIRKIRDGIKEDAKQLQAVMNSCVTQESKLLAVPSEPVTTTPRFLPPPPPPPLNIIKGMQHRGMLSTSLTSSTSFVSDATSCFPKSIKSPADSPYSPEPAPSEPLVMQPPIPGEEDASYSVGLTSAKSSADVGVSSSTWSPTVFAFPKSATTKVDPPLAPGDYLDAIHDFERAISHFREISGYRK